MKLPLGISCLDGLLDGGLETGLLTQIYGEAASGKTTLGLIAAVAARRMGSSVLYINAEASSPIERLEQVAGSKFAHLNHSIRIIGPRNFEEQGLLLEEADLIIQKNTRLLVVDTLTRLYRISLENRVRNYEAHRELNRQAGILKGLARQHNLSVVILNQVRSSMKGNNEFEPVARNIMEYWADVTLRLKIGTGRGERIIERTTNSREQQLCHLFLTTRGFQMEPAV